jgi:hypothetical protein
MGRSIPPHEPSLEIMLDQSEAALIPSALRHHGFARRLKRGGIQERFIAAEQFEADPAEDIQETADMSAKSNLSAKAVDFEAAARERMLPGVDVFAEAEKLNFDTGLEMIEAMQFERGYN